MNRVESAGLTDVGKKRKENQDALLIDEPMGLYVVSDGMGGHRAGEVASRLVVQTLHDVISNPQHHSNQSSDASLSPEANLLIHAVTMANETVYREAAGNPSYQGMGATVSAVLFSDRTLIAANVGDSPIYLIHNNRIEQLSVPHTLMAEHRAADPEGKTSLDPKFKHVLTRAVGTRESVRTDICQVQHFTGDILVIGSDGLSNQVDPEEIIQIVQQSTPKESCRRLVALANERGGDDNVTVVVVKPHPKRFALKKIIKRFSQFFWRE